MESLILDWLIEQAPIIVVLGLILIYTVRMYRQEKTEGIILRNKYETEKSELVQQLISLTAEVTLVTSTIVTKMEAQSSISKDINLTLIDINTVLTEVKATINANKNN